MTDYRLYLHIVKLRARLEAAGEKYGLTHPLTLALSRRLDKLILEAQRRGAA